MHKDETLTDTSPRTDSGETIVALSTARGMGAVAVVRLSGAEAWTVARKMVTERKKFAALDPRNMALFDLIGADRADDVADDLDRSARSR